MRDVRRLLPLLADPVAQSKPLPEIIQQHLPDLLALLGDSLIFPPNVTLDDLSLSECEAIGMLWWEIHRDFFLRALGLVGTSLLGVSAPTSTVPV